ncbi:MAG: hypothetical protein Q4F65_05055 [Propionibacteriaceae bacterium]|nr:hypothetical protein [Propionibacteriaceae bacterium]
MSVVPRHVAYYRYAVLALLVAVGIGILALGTRPAPVTELGQALASGRVTEVTVANALAPGATGTATAEVRWHDGLLPRFTTVRQVAPPPGQDGGVVVSEPDQPVTTSIEEWLTGYTEAPLAITHVEDRTTGTTWWLYGWKVPAWVALPGLLAGLLTLSLLITGPEPLRATRWAWFWAIGSPLSFVTLPLFLLIGLPRTGAIEQPYTKAGRLTGGWSFLLFCVLGATVMQNLT